MSPGALSPGDPIAGPAHAIQTCELGGQPVDSTNGAATAGKTGLMRCRDADTGAVLREQELRDGRFMGIVRHFKDGQVEREFSVNEKGNRDGLARGWSVEESGHFRGLAATPALARWRANLLMRERRCADPYRGLDR